MDQIFNELSACCCYQSKQSANAGIERMLKLVIEMNKIGYTQQLRTVRDFRQLEIAPQYTINDWVYDRNDWVDRDFRRLLLTFAAKSPYVEDFLDTSQKELVHEFTFDGSNACGLGLACLWGSCTLSLDGDSRFANDRISLRFYQIDDTREMEEIVQVINLTTLEHVLANSEILRKSFVKEITNGSRLLQQSERLFPNLSFSEKAKKQIAELTGSEQYFYETVRHLSVLHETIANWSIGPFDPKGITWSVESVPTLHQYGTTRQFTCSDGVDRLFSCHSKLMSANKRIYFYPITEQHTVHIGYVGDHLPTHKYQT